MIAVSNRADMAVATGGMLDPQTACLRLLTLLSPVTYLFRTTGQVLGVSLSGAVLQAVLVKKLRERITGPDAAEASHCMSGISHCADFVPSSPRSSVTYGSSFAKALMSER